MKTISEVEQMIRDLLVNELEIQPNVADGMEADTPLLGRGIGLDSMETLTLVTGIEQAFEIQIEDDELTTDLFRTLGTLADYVVKKVNATHKET